MKVMTLIALFLFSACATNKPSVPIPQLVQEKEGDEVTSLLVTNQVFNYEPNSAQLDPVSQEKLNQLIGDVSKNQKRYKRIEITGHSDQTGTEDLNLEISKERALAVLELMKQAGIDRKKIRTSWLAGTEPVVEAIDSSINRRVEIKFFEIKKDPL